MPPRAAPRRPGSAGPAGAQELAQLSAWVHGPSIRAGQPALPVPAGGRHPFRRWSGGLGTLTDPSDPATVIGPLVNAGAARQVSELVASAVAAGARVLTGGGEADGARFPATVLADATPDMRIFDEEIFGSAVTVITVNDDEQAVAIANDTPYGLTAGVITEDSRRGLALARRLQTGIVHVNDQTVDDQPQVPFGDVKDSGYGKFGGRWAWAPSPRPVG
ncbi:aldehyde dehydrogenase family protein [Kutzneria sp. 744]|uniref:aldehyde dehydrogenase family protein n=1 Tax=Kutzneria sp. (strain 744) TaxID=345341 RepID=UPI002101A2DB|nr:aldehyde dehydrogenase family protein [Kutzneria sp. 744]